jgi:D-glycero-beta-D-manno-heptose-7-phosphate kinase
MGGFQANQVTVQWERLSTSKMNNNDNFKPEQTPKPAPEKQPDKQSQPSDQDNASNNLSLAQIFSGPKGVDYKSLLDNSIAAFSDDRDKGGIDRSGLPGISAGMLTKELSRELKSPNANNPGSTTFKTFFVPYSKYVDASGLEQRPFVQARKSEFKPTDQKTADQLLNEAPKEDPTKKADDKEPKAPPKEVRVQAEKEEPVVDLEVDNIYSEVTTSEQDKWIRRHEEEEEEFSLKKPLLDEMERVHPHDTAIVHSHGLNKGRLRECIENFGLGRVLIVGDLIIDELLEGRPERISREAPVIILEHVDTELIPGGAANTAHNIVALGGRSHAVGVCGKDDYTQRLASMLDKYKIEFTLVQDPTRPTTVKTRILSKSHSFKQQLLRLDRISHDTIDSAVEAILAQRIEPIASQYQALILSDYRCGIMTDKVIEACKKISKAHNLLVVVDAQDGFERFQDVDLITPNQPDAEGAVGYVFDSETRLVQGGEDLLLLTGAKSLLVTRGAKGMALFRLGEEPVYLPPFNRSEVFDVTGAGDTVIATMTLALVTGATLEEAMALGNLAAGIVVRKTGTAVTSQKEMLENLEQLKLLEE